MSVGHQKTEMHTAVGSECLYQVQFHPCPHESQGFMGFLSFGGCTGKRWTWAWWENPGEILALESSLQGCGLLVHMNPNVSDNGCSSNWKHHPCSPTLTSKTPSVRLIRILIPKITQERTALHEHPQSSICWSGGSFGFFLLLKGKQWILSIPLS